LKRIHHVHLPTFRRITNFAAASRYPRCSLCTLCADRSIGFLSGHISKKNGQVWAGQLGKNIQTEEGKAAARAVAIDLLGTLHAAVGDLNKVKRIVKVMSLVNSTADFTEQHLVTNGCSELLGQVFGDLGVHARSAFGVAQLPMGACVEIELIAEVA